MHIYLYMDTIYTHTRRIVLNLCIHIRYKYKYNRNKRNKNIIIY